MVAGTTAMPTTVLHITPGKKGSNGTPPQANENEDAKEEAKQATKQAAEIAAQLVRNAAKQIDSAKLPKGQTQKDAKELDVTVLSNKTAETEVIAQEAEKGYDMLVIGLQNTTVRGHKFNINVTQLAAGFEGPLVIVEARDGHIKDPSDAGLSILVPVNGTGPSRRAAEVAIALAQATRAPVTALYVAPPSQNSGKKRARPMVDAVLKDIVVLGDNYDVDVLATVRKEKGADEAILKEAAKRRHNLIVIGVERRPGEDLFLGETATAILEKSDRSIVFVVS
jgi:nucleotide-binding universal stress UspA family protein